MVIGGADGDGGHGLEPVFTGGKGRGSGPKIKEFLSFDLVHFIYYRPEPALQLGQLLSGRTCAYYVIITGG